MNQTSLRRLFDRPVPVLRVILLITLFLTFAIHSGADVGQASVRLSADPDLVALSIGEDSMSISDLIEVSLIASGVAADDRPEYARRIMTIIRDIPPRQGSIVEDAEGILQSLHAGVLKRYVESQTGIDVLLDRGTYNCVSSAVLYMIVARSRDIPVYGIQTSDHAFCRVSVPSHPEGGYDVETTIPFGFDPGRRHDAVDSFSGRTGFIYVPPSNYRNRFELNERELIALIYQNRLAAYQRSGRWIEAVGLARDRWELAGSETSLGDFITSLDNYAAEMNRRQKHEEALGVLAAAAEVLPDSGLLANSARSLLHNAVVLRLRAGDTAAAGAVIDNPTYTGLVSSDFIDDLRLDIDKADAEAFIMEADFEEAIAEADRARSEGLINASRWEEFTLHLWSTEARRRSNGGRWIDGWLFVEDSTGDTRRLLERNRVLSTYAHNAVVGYHNDIVSHLRAGRLDRAEALLVEAEGYFPGNDTLRQDRRSIEQLRNQQ